MAKTQKSEGQSGAAFLTAMSEFQKVGLWPMPAAFAAWCDCMGDMGGELAEFLARRIREDVKFQHSVLHCTNPVVLREMQAEFMQKAIDQYTAETGRIAEMNQEMMERLLGEMSPEGEDQSKA
ncbi:MAG: phasin family protein [Rhodobacteraceae bacterium]|nr:phasin family protein [Paracoccaceae bacterium]